MVRTLPFQGKYMGSIPIKSKLLRNVTQLVSVPALGAGSRKFESYHSEGLYISTRNGEFFTLETVLILII